MHLLHIFWRFSSLRFGWITMICGGGPTNSMERKPEMLKIKTRNVQSWCANKTLCSLRMCGTRSEGNSLLWASSFSGRPPQLTLTDRLCARLSLKLHARTVFESERHPICEQNAFFILGNSRGVIEGLPHPKKWSRLRHNARCILIISSNRNSFCFPMIGSNSLSSIFLWRKRYVTPMRGLFSSGQSWRDTITVGKLIQL